METQNYTEEELCNIWNKCKEELKKTVSSLHYETYISSLKLIEIQGDTAHLPYLLIFALIYLKRNITMTSKMF